MQLFSAHVGVLRYYVRYSDVKSFWAQSNDTCNCCTCQFLYLQVEIVLPNVDDELERVKPHTIAVAMGMYTVLSNSRYHLPQQAQFWNPC